MPKPSPDIQGIKTFSIFAFSLPKGQNQAPIFRGLRRQLPQQSLGRALPKPSPDIQGIKTRGGLPLHRQSSPKPSPDIQGIKTSIFSFRLRFQGQNQAPIFRGLRQNVSLTAASQQCQNQAPIFRGLRRLWVCNNSRCAPKPSPDIQGIKTSKDGPVQALCSAKTKPRYSGD